MQKNQLSDSEAFAFLESLFPGGLKDPVLIEELCPEGWEKSALFACYLDSYMGTSWIAKRADLSPAYRLIFRRFPKGWPPDPYDTGDG